MNLGSSKQAPAKWHLDYKGRELHFMRDVLGLAHPRTGRLSLWEFSRYLVGAILKYKRVAVVSSRSTSKTFTIGNLTPAFLYTEPSRVIILGPTMRTIVKGVFGEARAAMTRSTRNLHTETGKTTTSEIRIDERHWALALPARDPGAIRGFHGDQVVPGNPDDDVLSDEDIAWIADQVDDGSTRLLILIDEATYVSKDAWDALGGMLTKPNVYLVATANATLGADEDHPFVNAFREGSGFHRIRVSSLPVADFPAPSGIGFDKVFDHVPEWLVSPESIETALRTMAKSDPILLGDWAGIFPSGSTTWNVIPREALEAALASDGSNRREIGPRIGVDVGYGKPDPCHASLFFDGVKHGEHSWAPAGDDPLAQEGIARTIAALAVQWGKQIAELYPERWDGAPIVGFERLSIDCTGSTGVGEFLSQQGIGFDRVIFSAAPDGQWLDIVGTQRFLNVRAEMYWCARRGLQLGVFQIPRRFRQSWIELPWTLFERDYDSHGAIIKLEKKIDVKARHKKSPDVADADVLALREMRGPMTVGHAGPAGGARPVDPELIEAIRQRRDIRRMSRR